MKRWHALALALAGRVTKSSKAVFSSVAHRREGRTRSHTVSQAASLLLRQDNGEDWLADPVVLI